MICQASSETRARRGKRGIMTGELRHLLRSGRILDNAIAAAIGISTVLVIHALVVDVLGGVAGSAMPLEGVFAEALGGLLAALAVLGLVLLVSYLCVARPRQRREFAKMVREEHSPTIRKCPECRSDIPVLARRCSHCTAAVEPVKFMLTAL